MKGGRNDRLVRTNIIRSVVMEAILTNKSSSCLSWSDDVAPHSTLFSFSVIGQLYEAHHHGRFYLSANYTECCLNTSVSVRTLDPWISRLAVSLSTQKSQMSPSVHSP